MKVRLVLASASPRRRELLAQLDVPFEVVASDVPETPRPGEPPAAFARRAARDKATAVARRCPDALVLAADTVVVVDAAILGKPRDRADARRMLEALSGRTHEVLTAVALRAAGGHVEDVVVRSAVQFRALAAHEIDAYVDSDEPYDKAGAYAIQGRAHHFIVQVQGSYTNVVGLPVDEVRELLRQHLPARAAMPHTVS